MPADVEPQTWEVCDQGGRGGCRGSVLMLGNLCPWSMGMLSDAPFQMES